MEANVEDESGKCVSLSGHFLHHLQLQSSGSIRKHSAKPSQKTVHLALKHPARSVSLGVIDKKFFEGARNQNYNLSAVVWLTRLAHAFKGEEN